MIITSPAIRETKNGSLKAAKDAIQKAKGA